MSRELLLLRHAKSSWDDAGLSDMERGLNHRGRRNAPRMGLALSDRLAAQPIYVSPAKRAQLTLGGLQDGWPALQSLPHVTEDALYTFDYHDLVAWLRSRDDAEQSVFMIGHNPAFTDLVNWIAGSVVLDNLPTAGFARLTLAIGAWTSLDGGCGSLVETVFPRSLDR